MEQHISGATIDLTLHDTFLVFRNTSVTHIDVREPFDVTEKVKVKASDQIFRDSSGRVRLGQYGRNCYLGAEHQRHH